ncbi:MAG: tetratricopeptide repeat protein [Cyclobacteriaceae bacterium]|nr:tetratricopeptide repeat protein [Cyclobacteriaceae bacterium]
MKVISILVLIFLITDCFGQSRPDSVIATLSHQPDSVKVQTLNQLALQYSQRDNVRCRQYAEKGLEISKTINFSRGEADASCILCGVMAQQGQFSEALDMCKRAEVIYAKANYGIGLADVFNRVGLVYNFQGQYPQALESFTKSLKLLRQLNQKDKIPLTEENIGMVYFRQGDYLLALDYFKECYKEYQEQNNISSSTKILVNMGAAYNRLKMPVQALEAHMKSLEFFEKNNNYMGMGIANNNIGNVYWETKDYRKALTYYEKSLAIKLKMNDKRGTAVSLKNIAETYLILNEFDKAKENIDRSLKIAEEIGSKEQMKDAYDILVKVYEATKDYKKALTFEKKMMQAKDSLFSSEKTEQISRMRALYETEKAERETEVAKLEALKKDVAIELLNKEREVEEGQRNVLIIAVISLLAISLLIYFQFYQKKRSNQVLVEKNEIIGKALSEREILLREIHHRVKNNLQIISSLLNLQSRSVEDKAAHGAVIESRNRVRSMAMIHEQLYQEDTLTGVSMPEYVQHLVDSLGRSYGVDQKNIEWKLDVDALLLDVDTAIPLGLILNELLTNSLKYAFADQQTGSISVSLKQKNGKLHMLVSDTGKGIDVNEKSGNSFGLNLVNSLAQKLRAEVSISTDRGTRVELVVTEFKLANLKSAVPV